MYDDSSYDEIDLNAFEINSNGSPKAIKTDMSYNYESKESIDTEMPKNLSLISLTHRSSKRKAENNGEYSNKSSQRSSNWNKAVPEIFMRRKSDSSPK